jgi:hypothetical protein
MQTTPNKSEAEQVPTKPANANGATYSVQLLEKARTDTDTVLKEIIYGGYVLIVDRNRRRKGLIWQIVLALTLP